jgi:hypothetical protein
MRHLIVERCLPAVLLLMGLAVILILTGAGSAGLALGLVVAGAAGVLLLSTVLYDVTHSAPRYSRHHNGMYRGTRARGFDA